MHPAIKRRLSAFLIGNVFALPVGAELPDTGQTACYSFNGAVDCSSSTFPRQDGSQVATTGYTKLDAVGNDLDVSAVSWTCVKDNATGLIWESKSSDNGLQDVNHLYRWFNPFSNENGGDPGSADIADFCGNTLGAACNTANYVTAINEINYCGAADWRLPTQMELLTLVNAGTHSPTIDTNYFPNTALLPYWSATTYAKNAANAWGVHFLYGSSHAEPKSVANPVRLVRGVWTK